MYKPSNQGTYQKERTLAHKVTPYDVLKNILIDAPAEVIGKLEEKLKDMYDQGKDNLKQTYNNVTEFLNDYLIMCMGHGSKGKKIPKAQKSGNWHQRTDKKQHKIHKKKKKQKKKKR